MDNINLSLNIHEKDLDIIIQDLVERNEYEENCTGAATCLFNECWLHH